MSDELATQLAARTTGPVWSVGDAGYDDLRHGFDLALDHRPAVVLAAATETDIAEGIRFAAEHDLPVGLQATGHGGFRSMDGGLLIATRHLTGVRVDPERRVARISAGTTAGEVLAATAPHGLAAPVGAAPGVGYVSYSLGGGLGPLGRAYGYAADRIRRLEVVTADGRDLSVSADTHPELFWALRGGGGNLAAVVAIEIDLLPVAELYGGALFFPGEQAAELLDLLRQAVESAPDELTLSAAFLAFPDVPALPPPLRGRFCSHVRVAYLGDAEEGARLVAPLRAAAPFLDTVRIMPITDIGSIHADPTQPVPVHSNSVALTEDDVLGDLVPFIEPDSGFLLEVRQLGGGLARPSQIPNAVGHRHARLNLFTTAFPGLAPADAYRRQEPVYDTVAQASAGGPLRTFLPSHFPDASSCYEADTAAELARLASVWDPSTRFRFAPRVTARG